MCPTTTDDDRSTVTPEDRRDSIRDAVVPLLAIAAVLPPDDDAWEDLRAVAGDAIDDLIGRGALPSHLTVGRGDPPAVVSRTLAVVVRRLAADR